MQTLFIFIVFLGPLIFFHELGHFLFARLFGVRVEVFSIGFGPKIFKKKIGDTEYAISIIPLGGYVKMFGDNPLSEEELTEEEKKVAYTHKSKWARFWIVFGGPLANFILAFFLYFALVLSGEKVPQAKLGFVKEGTSFHTSGLRSGDVVLKVNDMEIVGMDDFNLIDSNISTITVLRNSSEKVIQTNFGAMDFINGFSEISPARSNILVDKNGKYYYASLNSKPEFGVSLEETFENIKNLGQVDLYLFKVESELKGLSSLDQLKLDLKNPQTIKTSFESFYNDVAEKGLYLSDLSIFNVTLGSAAAKAGLVKNDVILSLQGVGIKNFEQLKEIVSNSKEGEKLSLKVKRGDKVLDFFVTPQVKGARKLIGIQSGIVFFPTRLVNTSSSGITTSFIKAFYRTKEGITKTALGFKKLILGEVSIKHIGGPFQIASVAADSFQVSLSMFFRLMALISINLGLINLFPIPVLDGGHIVMLVFEAINRGPLSKKMLMRLQQVGVSILFLLMFVAIANDVSKFF